jgi:PKD repeat protein
VGDTFDFVFEEDLTIDLLGPADTAQIWDYSGITPTTPFNTLGFFDPGLIQAPHTFTLSNAVHVNYRSQFGINPEFIIIDSNFIVAEGFIFQGGGGAPAQSIPLIEMDTFLKYPFTFGDTLNSNYFSKAMLESNNPNAEDTLEQHVEKRMKYDAFGTLKTIFGEYEVIRETERILQFDTITSTDQTTGLVTKTPIPYTTPGVDSSVITRFWSKEFSAPIFAHYFREIAEGHFLTQYMVGAIANFEYAGNLVVGDSITFTDNSSSNAQEFAWDFGDNLGTSNEEDPSYVFKTADTFTVSLTATNQYGGTTLAREMIIKDSTATSIQFSEINSLRIYPNPSTNFILISTEKSRLNGNVSIVDLTGKEVLFQKLTSSYKNTIDVQSLAKGTYIISVTDEHGKNGISTKIIVK